MQTYDSFHQTTSIALVVVVDAVISCNKSRCHHILTYHTITRTANFLEFIVAEALAPV